MTTLVLIAAAMAASPLRADDPVAPPPTRMQGGEAVSFIDPTRDEEDNLEPAKVGASGKALVVVGGADESTTKVIELDKPAITASRYLVKGWVRYTGVIGDGYIEMLNRFGENEYFSRTMGESGPMGKLTGDGGWRVFTLPFNAEPGQRPDRIAVNVVLPGEGKVMLTDVRLVQFGGAPTTTPNTTPNTTPTTAPAAPAGRSQGAGPLTPTQLPGMAAAPRTLAIALGSGILVAGASAVVAVIARRRRRRDTISSELRRMHALDAV